MQQPLAKELSFLHQGVRTVILAGGRNARLRPIEVPKAMMRVNGCRLIDYTLKFLESNGLKDVTVIGNEKDIELFRTHSSLTPIAYEYLHERDDMGTGNALRRFANLQGTSEDILLLVPSVILDVDIDTAYRHHREQRNLITVVKPISHIEKSEFRIIGRGELLEYLLNFNPYDGKREVYDSVPIIIINNTVLRFLGPKKYLDLKENILLPLLKSSSRFVAGIEISGTYQSVFNFHDLHYLNQLIEKHNVKIEAPSFPCTADDLIPPLIKRSIIHIADDKASKSHDSGGIGSDVASYEFFLKDKTSFMTRNRFYLILKRGLDIILSSTAILALSPLFCIIYCLIRVDSKGPGFYIHERLGYKGKKLNLIKFRTMAAGSQKSLRNEEEEREFYRQFKLENDSRITKIGRYLRKYSLDELPQFVNILSGSMTLVGPRPIVSEEGGWYGIHLPLLLSVKPGITSFWSIKGRNQIPYPHRANIELDYISKMSLLTDLKVLFKTITAIFSSTGL